jgi:outer membrane usher protein
MKSLNISFGFKNYVILLLSLNSIALSCAAENNTPSNSITPTNTDDFIFEPSMLLGDSIDKKDRVISEMGGSSIPPGRYFLDIYLNGNFLENNKLELTLDKNGQIMPCISKEYLIASGILAKNIHPKIQCDFAKQIDGASFDLDAKNLRLNLYVPQIALNQLPRGSVPNEKLNAGDSMFFVNYDSNYYRSKDNNSGLISDSGYLNLQSGINLGLWQLRQKASLTSMGDGHNYNTNYNSQELYVQRPIVPLKSELIVGQTYTPGDQFSSIGLTGIKLSSDDRMLPDSQRGYAPNIHGIAHSNAKVTIKQMGNTIYQSSVPAGNFVINDLYPTSYQGDLQVEIEEADGSVSSFTVPFNAVPGSVRAGQYKFDLAAGEVRDVNLSNVPLIDALFRYGASNSITLNTGTRFSDNYSAFAFGGVYSNWSGAYALNAVNSISQIPGEGRSSGWKFGLTYSKDIEITNTNFSLAAFRYSTAGYYDLNDVLGLRSNLLQGDDGWQSTTYKQRSQFTATINQSMGRWGNIYLSGSASNYRGGKGSDVQFQSGYNTTIHGIAFTLSLARQQYSRPTYVAPDSMDIQPSSNNMENTLSLSFSVPLGSNTNVGTSFVKQSGQTSDTGIQSNMNGTLGQDNNFSYNINASTADNGAYNTYGGTIQQQFSSTTLGAGLSTGQGYQQGSASLRGAMVVHSGGVTFGPYVGDTFALIEAKDAEGAKVRNSSGARIDSHGYALLPNLMPYRYNDVLLDTSDMHNNNIDVVTSESQLAPYYGASVKLKVKTTVGYPLLIEYDDSNFPLLFGSDVYDEQNNAIGLVSQGGMIYVRVPALAGKITAKGDGFTCSFAYDISKEKRNQPIYHLSSPCIKVSKK